MVDAMSQGNTSEAEIVALKYHDLFVNLFLEVNPVPTKEALAMISPEIYTPEVRLPMVGMAEENREVLMETLREIGVVV